MGRIRLFVIVFLIQFYWVPGIHSYLIQPITEVDTTETVFLSSQDTAEHRTNDESETLFDSTTEFYANDDENEISRDKRDVDSTVASFDEAVTTNSPNSNIDDDVPLPSTPFPHPDADYHYPTVNPIPDDFDPFNLTDIDLSSGLIQGSRASCQCGKPSNRIVGGTSASIRQYPWMVGLTRGSGRPFCGGTLINSRYVVTASHCVHGQSASRITVVLNEQDFNSNLDGARPLTVRVERIKMHENYNSQNINNDIALLRLSQNIPLGNQFTPICLPSSNANDFAGEQATVTGWGATSQGGSTSSYLRQVTVPVLSNKECNSRSKYNGKITENMMCAGLLTSGGKDSCQGDSGGPLIIDNGGRKTLIGIVSWGYGCAQAYSPGVYTRVANYPNWILANTQGADWCQG